jgi:hypothetical protein
MADDLAHVQGDDNAAPHVILIEQRWCNVDFAG